MWTKFRHKIVFALLRPFLAVFIFFKYGYRFQKFKSHVKKPYFILSNHVTTIDFFMIAVSFNIPIYYIASDDIFSIKFYSSIIKYLVAPIPKTKASSDLKTIKDCYKIAKEGGTICVFPEGNRTYNGVTTAIPFSIIKLIKLLKLPLLTYKIEGGYGVQPRWATNIRKGKTFGSVKSVLTYDKYKDMRDDELYKYVCENIYVNDFEYTKLENNKYKSKEKAKNIERFLYVCTNCGSFSTLKGIKNDIVCKKCQLKVYYGEDLQLKTLSGKCDFKNVKQWDDFQKNKIREFDLENIDLNQLIFSDTEINLKQNIRCEKKIEMGKGKMSLYKDRIEIKTFEKNVFYLNEILDIAIYGKNKMQFYYNDKIFQIIGNDSFNALKYQNMYYHIKNKRQGVNDGFLGL